MLQPLLKGLAVGLLQFHGPVLQHLQVALLRWGSLGVHLLLTAVAIVPMLSILSAGISGHDPRMSKSLRPATVWGLNAQLQLPQPDLLDHFLGHHLAIRRSSRGCSANHGSPWFTRVRPHGPAGEPCRRGASHPKKSNQMATEVQRMHSHLLSCVVPFASNNVKQTKFYHFQKSQRAGFSRTYSQLHVNLYLLPLTRVSLAITTQVVINQL